MIVDLSQNPARQVDGDVCIAGAGPAGLSLALELSALRPDWRIILAEAGGFSQGGEHDLDTYRVELGERRYPVEASRRRQLGGTSAHWGGWCKPLDAADYHTPPGWPMPGWPIGPEALDPHIQAASAWCEIPSTDYDAEGIARRNPGSLLELPANAPLTHRLFRFSPPTRFGERYRAHVEQRENLHCLLHASLIGMEHKGGRCTAVLVRSLQSVAPTRIVARNFVLAMGGLENARFLLNVRGGESDDGEGIRSPYLGRYFADHFGLTPGVALAPEQLRYFRFGQESGPVMPVLAPSENELREGRFSNCSMLLTPVAESEPVRNVYGGQPGLGFRTGKSWTYRVQMIVEPRPNRDSRVTLVEDRCSLGLKRAHLDWRIDARDFEAVYAQFNRFGQLLGELGLGRTRLQLEDNSEVRANVGGAFHHMGTTRMSASSEHGVVDANSRVFGMENLYVTGSSVFPRYGYSNPTLTIVALAVRLAHHLSAQREGARV